jgi:hypothetical protein
MVARPELPGHGQPECVTIEFKGDGKVGGVKEDPAAQDVHSVPPVVSA